MVGQSSHTACICTLYRCGAVRYTPIHTYILHRRAAVVGTSSCMLATDNGDEPVIVSQPSFPITTCDRQSYCAAPVVLSHQDSVMLHRSDRYLVWIRPFPVPPSAEISFPSSLSCPRSLIIMIPYFHLPTVSLSLSCLFNY